MDIKDLKTFKHTEQNDKKPFLVYSKDEADLIICSLAGKAKIFEDLNKDLRDDKFELSKKLAGREQKIKELEELIKELKQKLEMKLDTALYPSCKDCKTCNAK